MLYGCGPRHLADAGGDLVFGAGKNTAMKRRTTRSYSFCSASDRLPWGLRGGDDGKVVADLAVVEDALGRADVVVVQRLRACGARWRMPLSASISKRLARHGQIVLGQARESVRG